MNDTTALPADSDQELAGHRPALFANKPDSAMWEDVQEAYSAARSEPAWRRFKDPWKFYAPGAIAGRQARWAKEDARAEEGDAGDEDVLEEVQSAIPYFSEAPKIGRNDPCPCGSGKKYKKCCLARDRGEL